MDSIKVAVLTDTDADIPKELLEQYPIFVLPLPIEAANEEYKDGVNITVDEIYRRQKTEDFKTSLPLRSDIDAMLDQIKSQGYTHVLALMIASALSSTTNQMSMIAKERKDLQMLVYDTESSSVGVGIIALQAAQYALQVEKGEKTLEWLKKAVVQLVTGTAVFFSLDTLEYLRRGGRIGKATELVGTLLQVKPILTFRGGVIHTAAKVRGNKAVPGKLLELVSKAMDELPQKVFSPEEIAKGKKINYNLVICDGGCPEEGAQLEEKVKEAFPDYQQILHGQLDATLAVHLGPNLLGAGIQILPE